MATLPDSFVPHPARDVSRRSMEAVEARDRDAWLAVFADDAVVEDPIGPSAFDPDGAGHRGRDAIAAFYDAVIGPNEAIRFELTASYAGGNEVANVGTIFTTLPGGMVAETDGVFTYRINDAGQLVALRAYWQMDDVRIA